MEESWTITELAELAAEALARPGTLGPFGMNGPDQPAGELGTGPGEPDGAAVRANGRVRDVPNERLIRWYGTVGLVDPPLSRRGRVARYGRRHLLQLIAVKRRQAEGKSLAQIQAELAGATDEVLAAVARVPAGLRQQESEVAGRFWARQPRQPGTDFGDPGAPTAGAPAAGAPTAGVPTAGVPTAGAPAAGLVHGIRLAPGVLLLLDGADRQPGPEDMTRIANAARPLLRELASRGLGGSGPQFLADPRYLSEVDQPQTGAGYEH
jgi:DNA-binding transcriptional MerR regulator